MAEPSVPMEEDAAGGGEWSGEYVWEVTNFSGLPNKVYSPPFVVGTYTWRLLLYPLGLANDFGAAFEHMSLFLDHPESSWAPGNLLPRATFRFTVLNQLIVGEDYVKANLHRWNRDNTDWGFTQFMPLTQFNSPDSGYLIDDKMRIKVEITVQPNDNPDGHRYCRILLATDQNMMQQVGPDIQFDLVDFDSLPVNNKFRLDKNRRFSEFQAQVAELTGVLVPQQRFWVWQQRRNDTIRPTQLLRPSMYDQQLVAFNDDRNREAMPDVVMELRLYLEQPTATAPLQEVVQRDTLCLFFKYYNWQTQELSYVGHQHVPKTHMVSELYPLMRQMAGLPPHTPLLAFEEVKFKPIPMIPQLDPDMTFQTQGQYELESGDIICFQAVPAAAVQSAAAAAAAAGAAAGAGAGGGQQQQGGGASSSSSGQQQRQGGGVMTVAEYLRSVADRETAAAQETPAAFLQHMSDLIMGGNADGAEQDATESTAVGPAPMANPPDLANCRWLHDPYFLRRRVFEQAKEIQNLRQEVASQRQEMAQLRTENALLTTQLQAAMASAVRQQQQQQQAPDDEHNK